MYLCMKDAMDQWFSEMYKVIKNIWNFTENVMDISNQHIQSNYRYSWFTCTTNIYTEFIYKEILIQWKMEFIVYCIMTSWKSLFNFILIDDEINMVKYVGIILVYFTK